MYGLIFLAAQMALVGTIFQMFIVLGMYTFGVIIKHELQPRFTRQKSRQVFFNVLRSFVMTSS